ncbi:hypothetical protein D3C76_25660 [compost metagenome]
MTDAINYHEALHQLTVAAEELLRDGAGVIFTTQCRKKLAARYMSVIISAAEEFFPDQVAEIRQHYRCSHCFRFMERAGHLVVADKHNEFGVRSVFWNPEAVSDPFFKKVVAEMKQFVEAARIQGAFNEEGPYRNYVGTTSLGGKSFDHFYIPQGSLTHRVPVLNKPISLGKLNQQLDRMTALQRLIKEVSLETVMYVDSLFQAKTIEHVGEGAKSLEDLKGLLGTVGVAKSLPAYTSSDSEYVKETLIVNKVWMAAMTSFNLLALRGSLLGKLLIFTHKALLEGARETQLAGIIKFWKTQTDGLHYMRTTREASESQVQRTARFLEEGGWMESLRQVEAAEIEIPVVWAAKAPWAFEEAHVPVADDFGTFAARKGVEMEKPANQVNPIDLGYFFNEVLPYVDQMGLVATGLYFMPIMINRMADLNAKPIFKYDSEEKRAPFAPWRYNEQFNISQLIKDPSVQKGGEVVIPVLSVTTSSTLGYTMRSKEENIAFLFGGIGMKEAPRPALFAESLKSEFYEHRRALEDYCRETQIPRSTTQQAISMFFGPRHPQQTKSVGVIVHVRLNEEGQARFGRRDARYRFDANGYTVAPNVEQYTVITDRSVQEAQATPAPKAAEASMQSL